jgi:choline dehydrogenase-like flavoprotein
VRAWEGIPQSYECTEHLDVASSERRVWIVPAFAHPMAAATMLPGHGRDHASWMARYERLGVFSAMLHDETPGRVSPDGALGVSIEYWPEPRDRARLMHGVWAAVHLMFAANAERVLIPSGRGRVIERGQRYDDLRNLDFVPGQFDVTSVHPMGTLAMADDPDLGPIGSNGAHHELAGLWVCDGSLFPESIGVPPQLSIYALALHVGRSLVKAAGA